MTEQEAIEMAEKIGPLANVHQTERGDWAVVVMVAEPYNLVLTDGEWHLEEF